MELRDRDYVFSTDKSKLDIGYVHEFLSRQSYWAEGIPLSFVEQSIQNSFCFGVYHKHKQIGFARIVTDYATFGYLADVFIDAAYRGQGLSKRLMGFIFSQQELKKLRRIVLATKDAHSLYAQNGFKSLAHPERFMELHRPDIYKTL